MMEFIAINMAPIMFLGLVVFLLSGYPVAFSLGANGLLFGLLGIGKEDKVRMKEQTGHNYLFFDAPVGFIFTMDRSLGQGMFLDYGMFLENVMIAARGRGVALEQASQRVRDGVTGPRKSGDIGFATLRGGEEVGVHTVMFAAAGERLELSHRSFSRETYAAGAVRAAQWLEGRKPGLYGMKDVLGL